MMTRSTVLGLALSITCGSACATADVLAFSGFDDGPDGWTAADFSIPHSANPPIFIQNELVDDFSTGGNPGGYISCDPFNTQWWCFVAPPEFLGDKEAAYGGFLRFDRVSTTVQFGMRPGLILVGAGMTLSYVTMPPLQFWASTAVPIQPAGWRVNNWETGPEPTVAQMKAVLAALEHVLITGQWYEAHSGNMALDNVLLVGPRPSDFDSDGDVDGEDLGVLVGSWGACATPCDADLNGDGAVDGADLGLLLGEWGVTTSAACPLTFHSCYVEGSAGCVDVGCCVEVCQHDPTCCTVQWDASCVILATALCPGCGNPSAGDCCTPHETASCDNGECCHEVCFVDASCCETAWDQDCANHAAMLRECGCSG